MKYKQIAELQLKVNELEQYSKRNNVIVSGLNLQFTSYSEAVKQSSPTKLLLVSLVLLIVHHDSGDEVLIPTQSVAVNIKDQFCRVVKQQMDPGKWPRVSGSISIFMRVKL